MVSISFSMNATPLPQELEVVGPWLQLYRAKIPGATLQARVDWLKRKADQARQLHIPGFIAHGFTSEMTPEVYTEFQNVCAQRGLLCGAAWGLNTQDPVGKGQRIGAIARLRGSDGRRLATLNVFDMEGAFDQDETGGKGELMFRTYEDVAGTGTLVCDQPWFAPSGHGNFPWKSTDEHVVVRCPQVYVNDFTGQFGDQRYERVMAWHLREWAALEARMAKESLPARARIPTIQGYGWRLADLVTCLVTYPSTMMWCEPWPEVLTITGIQARNALAAHGFTGLRAVWNFQASAKLSVDGQVGPMTLKALGVTG
jgi:hypothetical protein